MLDKVKITIAREDGSPICGLVQEPDTVLLTDEDMFFVAKKDGETVKTWAVNVPGLLELTLAALNDLSVAEQKAVCEGYGVKVN